ncbi:50S ribosomal protein L20 [Candidatus Portiera aleyrodidarum]|uniref:Large ribosomal subunit protein bL20 n=1 Tax=Candidatus Portiera aleyrodidarum TaxID=91844 RepID=A0A6S6RYS0_9GAMM|nr:50S ribosomal protein L20 [Candidatus Portiera aleyrodidarum]CAA3706899.1 50S ribosomal protein L20 [Candidatus Portiera aleyrodidarum]
MSRIKRGVFSHKHHKKIIKQAKGYYGARSRVYRVAKQAIIKAKQYAFRDRRQRKRQFRTLWIMRLNAAARSYGINYSNLIYLIKTNKININRKILAEFAIRKTNYFYKIIKKNKNME